MKYVDEFRDPAAARRLVREIRRRATRRWTLMEVCGGQTHALLRSGIESELADVVDLIHGPGCPVCVTDTPAIDRAQRLALADGVTLASFGDMLRVPGSRESLLQTQARGGRVRIVYSPLDALETARRDPATHVVFFAVGFETTAPATALAVRQAAASGLTNFSLLVAHVRVQPAMEAIAAAADRRVQGFLAAGHVCTVTGYETYADFSRRHRLPVVVTGFEPIDLLEGILACISQLEAGRSEAENQYARSVRRGGNRLAQDVIDEVFEVCDREWRGMGWIAGGGLRLRPAYRAFDAEERFAAFFAAGESWRRGGADGADATAGGDDPRCLSGRVLAGAIKPPECPAFGNPCAPASPLGAPMVSSEGACAAYFRFAHVARRPAPATAGAAPPSAGGAAT